MELSWADSQCKCVTDMREEVQGILPAVRVATHQDDGEDLQAATINWRLPDVTLPSSVQSCTWADYNWQLAWPTPGNNIRGTGGDLPDKEILKHHGESPNVPNDPQGITYFSDLGCSYTKMQLTVIFNKPGRKLMNSVCMNKSNQPEGCLKFCTSEGIWRQNKNQIL